MTHPLRMHGCLPIAAAIAVALLLPASASASDPDPTDMSGHGTHVSGIALAEGNNGIGVTGVSQRAALMSLRICGTFGSGCSTADEIAAINYAGANGAQVLNGSLQGSSFSQGVQDAMAAHPHVLYIFAAGNGGDDGIGDDNDVTPTFPCATDEVGSYTEDNVICVAATDPNDDLAGFSNYGTSSVDLGAPGTDILSTSSEISVFSDDFEAADFAAKWANTSGPGWSTISEPPLNVPPFDPSNVGITDSPGGNYAPDTINEVTSEPVTLSALPQGGSRSCELDYFRAVHLGGDDTFVIEVLLNGVVEATGQPDNDTEKRRFIALGDEFDAGGQIQVRLRLTSDSSDEADGVHMDDIHLLCHGSPSDGGYEFLDGTSMATPMVSGAAALLLTQFPSLTPAEVKGALLNAVDPEPDLTGTTVSGGRLNVFRAVTDLNTGGSASGSGSSVGGETPAPPDTGAGDYVPGEVIVGYKQTSSPGDRGEARDEVGTKPVQGLGMARAQLLRITDGDSVKATVRQLENQPSVAYAEPNEVLHTAADPDPLVPDDPRFGEQWGLYNTGQAVNGGAAGTAGADVGAALAWNTTAGSPSTVVAVMDTGADLGHPDLQNELWTNTAEANGSPCVDDDGNGFVDDVHGYDFVGGGFDPLASCPSTGGGGSSSPAPPVGTNSGGANRRPNTFFKRKPRKVVETGAVTAKVVFRFGSTETNSTFKCQLDGVQYQPCSSKLVRQLQPARHVIKVRAVDSAGAQDASAAVYKFRIKRVEG
jgi:subtilisin family serine protease